MSLKETKEDLHKWKNTCVHGLSDLIRSQYSPNYFANKGPSSPGDGFSSTHVLMWELDCKESRAPRNCFWTVVLEKTLESPLDCKEIQAVHPKGDQSWVFTGRTDAEAETPILWPPDVKRWLIWKDPDAGKDWGQEEKGTTEDEMVGWRHQPNGHEFGKLQSWWWTGRPGMLQSMGSQRVGLNWVTKLNWTDSPNWSTDSAQSLYQNPSRIFASVDKLIWKFKWKCQGSFFLKMSKVEGLTLPNFQTYYKVIIIKTVVLA